MTVLRTLDGSKSPKPNTTSFGERGSLFFQIWYDGVEQAYCSARNCYVHTTATEFFFTEWNCHNMEDFLRDLRLSQSKSYGKVTVQEERHVVESKGYPHHFTNNRADFAQILLRIQVCLELVVDNLQVLDELGEGY